MIAYLKALLQELFTVPDMEPSCDDNYELLPLYHPDAIKYPDANITPPQICLMNEGDKLCIHRSVNDANKLLAADKLGYKITMGLIEACHYQADYDHYSVEKI